MTRIALFGGSFDPPHIAHQMAALYVLETQPVDELWIVPTYVHPFETKHLLPFKHRVEMCKLMAAPLGERVTVSKIEEELAQRPGFRTSRTLDLVAFLVEQGLEVRLVVGSDIMAETAKWYRWTDLVNKAPLIILAREGFDVPKGSVLTGVPMPAISSTQIRRAQAAGDPVVAQLVPRSVYAYMVQHNLYKDKGPSV
jgi:nicotinate-nucleotide adenylyltransferase